MTSLTRLVISLLAGVLILSPTGSSADPHSATIDENGRDPNVSRLAIPMRPLPTQSVPRDATRTDDGRNPGLPSPQDMVISGNLIVHTSTCVGFDCVNPESYAFDTIRLKENNTRITFMDTSTPGGFPARDWRLRANENTNGGRSAFFIDDMGDNYTSGGETPVASPFTIEAGARNNALYDEADGDIGIGTANPVTDIHAMTGNTPTLRLDQDASSGFTPQAWDVAGNEANFFVRDVTNGSTLPLRIQPGAPSSSIYIRAGGNVGIGTASPSDRLHVSASGATMKVTNTDPMVGTDTFVLDPTGNLTIAGLLLESSSREVKQNLVPVDLEGLLERVSSLNLYHWNYTADGPSIIHIGPMAEDFNAAFGLGADDKHIAALDASGVALSAIQALDRERRLKDAKIAVLEAELRAQREGMAQLSRELAELRSRLEKNQ